MDVVALVQQCAPVIEPGLATRLLKRESGYNPFAIGLDGKERLLPQPRTYEEAVRTAETLIKQGKTFSVGISQVHISNVRSYRLTWRQAFDPCTNLAYGQKILQLFHAKALKAGFTGDDAVFAALRGYNSGDIYASVSNDYAAAILGRPPSFAVQRVVVTPIPKAGAYKAAAPAAPSVSTDTADFFSSYLATRAESAVGDASSDVRSDGQTKDFFED
ncbi:MAG TPA: lytic transglycosylase domain-containing protein [Noviherbaspirillum sp.]|nr:lytic transglycosylase domain-containing protein [Noviherbaspirillum sp.]